jgi:hypothetical protein
MGSLVGTNTHYVKIQNVLFVAVSKVLLLKVKNVFGCSNIYFLNACLYVHAVLICLNISIFPSQDPNHRMQLGNFC